MDKVPGLPPPKTPIHPRDLEILIEKFGEEVTEVFIPAFVSRRSWWWRLGRS